MAAPRASGEVCACRAEQWNDPISQRFTTSDTGVRSRQLVVRLDGVAPDFSLLDAEAAGLPVLLRWPLTRHADDARPPSPPDPDDGAPA